MKVFHVALYISLSFNLFSQADCLDYKTGKFIIKSEVFGNSYIERTKKFQIETGTNPETGGKSKTKDRIVWIDECTYQLIPIKIKDSDNIIEDDILTCKIIETGSDYYIVQISGIDDVPIDAKVQRQ